MNKAEISIATITLARGKEEEKTLHKSLESLASLQLPVFITDGGSPESFIQFLHSIPQFQIYAAKGLWPQAKKSITEAAKSGAKTIVYTEPDKELFFQQHLAQMIAEKKLTDEAGVVLASRTKEGFASFPLFQQLTEATINQCCREVIGMDTDYCYGPFLFDSGLVTALDFLPDNCGWGWRPALFATARHMGLTVGSWSGNFFCPSDQQEDDAKERMYRMKQLTQNIEGLLLATSVRK